MSSFFYVHRSKNVIICISNAAVIRNALYQLRAVGYCNDSIYNTVVSR